MPIGPIWSCATDFSSWPVVVFGWLGDLVEGLHFEGLHFISTFIPPPILLGPDTRGSIEASSSSTADLTTCSINTNASSTADLATGSINSTASAAASDASSLATSDPATLASSHPSLAVSDTVVSGAPAVVATASTILPAIHLITGQACLASVAASGTDTIATSMPMGGVISLTNLTTLDVGSLANPDASCINTSDTSSLASSDSTSIASSDSTSIASSDISSCVSSEADGLNSNFTSVKIYGKLVVLPEADLEHALRLQFCQVFDADVFWADLVLKYPQFAVTREIIDEALGQAESDYADRLAESAGVCLSTTCKYSCGAKLSPAWGECPRCHYNYLQIGGGPQEDNKRGRKSDWKLLGNDGKHRTYQHRIHTELKQPIAAKCADATCCSGGAHCSPCRGQLCRAVKRYEGKATSGTKRKPDTHLQAQKAARSANPLASTPLTATSPSVTTQPTTPTPLPSSRAEASGKTIDGVEAAWPSSWHPAPSNTAKGAGSWRAREPEWIFCPDPLDATQTGGGWVPRKGANSAGRGRPLKGMVWVPWAMADNGRRGKMMDQSTPEGAWASLPAHEPPSVLANRLQREKQAAKKASAAPAAAAAPKQFVFEYPEGADGRPRIPTISGVQSSFARSQAWYDGYRVQPGAPTMLETSSGRASNIARADEPRLTGLDARRIEHYETHLLQMRLVRCPKCDSRPLEFTGTFGPEGCKVCKKDAERYAVSNGMNPAPPGRLLQALREAEASNEAEPDPKKRRPLPLAYPLPGARYPPCFYEASVTEELLVTRFRTVMSVRHMPLKHRKYRGHTISFYQAIGEFTDMFNDLLPVPLTLDKLAIWIVRAQLHQGNVHQDYRVRRDLVAELLRWLPILLPKLYHDVNLKSGDGIDKDALDQLPDDATVFDQLPGSEYSAADASSSASTGASLSASANGPMMPEYVSGTEIDMDRSGFVGQPPVARNNEIARRAAEYAVSHNRKGQPVFSFPRAHTEGECEWNQCKCQLPNHHT